MFEQKQEGDKHEGQQIIERITRREPDYTAQVARFLIQLEAANQRTKRA